MSQVVSVSTGLVANVCEHEFNSALASMLKSFPDGVSRSLLKSKLLMEGKKYTEDQISDFLSRAECEIVPLSCGELVKGVSASASSDVCQHAFNAALSAVLEAFPDGVSRCLLRSKLLMAGKKYTEDQISDLLVRAGCKVVALKNLGELVLKSAPETSSFDACEHVFNAALASVLQAFPDGVSRRLLRSKLLMAGKKYTEEQITDFLSRADCRVVSVKNFGELVLKSASGGPAVCENEFNATLSSILESFPDGVSRAVLRTKMLMAGKKYTEAQISEFLARGDTVKVVDLKSCGAQLIVKNGPAGPTSDVGENDFNATLASILDSFPDGVSRAVLRTKMLMAGKKCTEAQISEFLSRNSSCKIVASSCGEIVVKNGPVAPSFTAGEDAFNATLASILDSFPDGVSRSVLRTKMLLAGKKYTEAQIADLLPRANCVLKSTVTRSDLVCAV